jgi:hypothetical protein
LSRSLFFTCITCGRAWNTLPTPWPMKSRDTLKPCFLATSTHTSPIALMGTSGPQIWGAGAGEWDGSVRVEAGVLGLRRRLSAPYR